MKQWSPENDNNMKRANKSRPRKRLSKKASKVAMPSPQVLQRAAKVVLSGKCQLSKPIHAKLKRHRAIIRKLASLSGKAKSKKAFLTRHKKQVGGFLPLLPIIASAVGSLLPDLLKGFAR